MYIDKVIGHLSYDTSRKTKVFFKCVVISVNDVFERNWFNKDLVSSILNVPVLFIHTVHYQLSMYIPEAVSHQMYFKSFAKHYSDSPVLTYSISFYLNIYI